MSPKVNLIYVASIGRSGSTLLETMLGAHQSIATMGEMHIWPHELRQRQRRCACGEHVMDCEFWREVGRRAQVSEQSPPRADYFREHHNGGRSLRLNRLRDFRAGYTPDANLRSKIDTYARNSEASFAAYRDVMTEAIGGQIEWVVDSSKDPYRLAWYKRSGLFNLRVIHMVKRPEAFVYSVTKQFLAGEQKSLVRQHTKALRQTGAWVVQNALFSAVANNTLDEDEYLLLPYEEFARDPHASFRRVTDFVGVEPQPSAVDDFRSGAVHTIAGNPMRYETRPIALDDKWRTVLPATSKAIARVVSAPLRARYGY